jgi:hypothetical protein
VAFECALSWLVLPRSASEKQVSGFVAHDGNVSLARGYVLKLNDVTGM